MRTQLYRPIYKKMDHGTFLVCDSDGVHERRPFLFPMWKAIAMKMWPNGESCAPIGATTMKISLEGIRFWMDVWRSGDGTIRGMDGFGSVTIDVAEQDKATQRRIRDHL